MNATKNKQAKKSHSLDVQQLASAATNDNAKKTTNNKQQTNTTKHTNNLQMQQTKHFVLGLNQTQ